MVKKNEVGRSLIYEVTEEAVANDTVPDCFQSSIAKLYEAETTEQTVSESLQVFGANGYQQATRLNISSGSIVRAALATAPTRSKNNIANQLFEKGLP